MSPAQLEGTDPIQVEDDLEGLTPGSEYRVRLKLYLIGADGESYLSDPEPHPTFTTLAETPPTVALAPTLVSGVSAHLSGTVTAGNTNATCSFEYISDPAFQNRNEQQSLAVKASGGTFRLFYEGENTPPLPFDAEAGAVQSSLEALAAIGAGNIAVSGGPGDDSGSSPYILTFIGSLATTDVSEVAVDPGALEGIQANAGVTTTVQGKTEGFAGAQAVPCDPAAIERDDSSTVEADISGLLGNTTYHLRLKASAVGGDIFDASTFITEAKPPAVLSTSVSDVDLTSANLNAQVNPFGDATTYHFEYLTLADYEAAGQSFAGATQTPESDSIGADNQGHLATAPISGLQVDTAYRFRVVATNAKGETPGSVTAFHTASVPVEQTCPNAAVRAQQGSAYLPECRAYEPVNSLGLDLGDVNRITYSSDDGDTQVYLTVGPGDDALGGGVVSISVASRGATGWASVNADPAATGGSNAGSGFTDPKGFSPDFSRYVALSVLPMNETDTDGVSDIYRVQVGSGAATLMSQDEELAVNLLGGASQDLERVVFLGTVGGITGIYVSDGAHTERLSVLPDGSTVGTGQSQLALAQYQRGLRVGGFSGVASSPFVERGGSHGISDDARRVYFVDFFGLYVRDLVASPARTVQLGVSSRTGDVGTVYPAELLSASHDGGTAYFVSDGQLTDEATPGGGIYRFDLAAKTSTQVTPDAGPGGLGLGGAIASDDQSHIYFTSTAALGGGAQAGDKNAYVWKGGDGVRFIGKVGNGAFARVGPNGHYALLLTNASLNGAPNNGFQALYRYDYATDEVICVSCRPDGAPSQGDAYIDAQSYGEPGAPLIRNRALSFDGRVAFTSTDRIVARDQTPASDVYLFHDGTVSLLSSGEEKAGSFVGDISDDGKSISVMTRAPLVAGDRDPEEYDAYVAYVNGGFLEAPPPPAPCEGEACRGGASNPPGAAPPSTPTFAGPPNPKPCAKGKTRRNGRCVKARKHRKHRKHHAGKKKSHKRDANDKRDANANGRSGR